MARRPKQLPNLIEVADVEVLCKICGEVSRVALKDAKANGSFECKSCHHTLSNEAEIRSRIVDRIQRIQGFFGGA